MLTEDEIRANFKHIGWFLWVPVYISDCTEAEPEICVRNGVPEWLFDVTESLYGFFLSIVMLLSPNIEPTYPFRITGEIVK